MFSTLKAKICSIMHSCGAVHRPTAGKQGAISVTKMPAKPLAAPERQICDIEDGETVYIVPDTLWVDADRNCYLRATDIVFSTPWAKCIKVTRCGMFYDVVIPRTLRHRTRDVSDLLQTSFIPVRSVRTRTLREAVDAVILSIGQRS
jgi:hypothetical protein